MFHVINRVYLELDFRASSEYKYIIASSRWFQNPIVNSIETLQIQALDFEDLIDSVFDGDVENLWQYILDEKDKLILYLEPDVILRLQIQYWKSLFDNITDEGLYELHKSFIETEQARSLMSNLDSFEKVSRPSLSSNKEYKLLPYEEFKLLAKDISKSTTLSTNMDKTKVSIEYLLAAHYASRERNELVSEELINRIGKVCWDIYLEEVKTLKMEILATGWNIFLLDSGKTNYRGSFESRLARSKSLSWILDKRIGTDLEYTKENLPVELFLDTFAKSVTITSSSKNLISKESDEIAIYAQWVRNIYEGRYEDILERDKNNLFTPSFYEDNYLTKVNFFFASNVLRWVREEDYSLLENFVISI